MEMLLMRTQLKINGELKDVEIENGNITIIKPEKKRTGWERVKCGEKQSFINCYKIFDSHEECGSEDNKLYECANYFSDRKLAENINRMQKLQRKMFRWQAENDEPIDLYSDCQKWIIVDDYEVGIKIVDYYKTGYGFMPVFSSLEKAEDCAKTFKNELIWLFAEFKWRMDG